MYEIYQKLLDKNGMKSSYVSQKTGVSNATLSDWKNGKSTPKADKMKKIADFFGVTVDYLMTGKSESKISENFLTRKDERDIAKDLDRIMDEIKNRDNGPLFYNGTEIDDESMDFLENAINFALRESKKENKVKYNPNKNKK